MARHIHIHLTRDAARMDANGVRSMTAGQINAELDKLDRDGSALTDALIDAGRGHERAQETLRKTDPLAMRFRANYERRMELRHEIESRYGPGAPSRLPMKGFGPRGVVE